MDKNRIYIKFTNIINPSLIAIYNSSLVRPIVLILGAGK